ncbi:single-stranded DNA-binding protein [Nocardia brasiliensis]|uniref:Single-stranded DNA-binding protein n=1 Tax=Nocardia brasiliensis (strain ATCC 700358 / HUJEG-1) TaxID=1133849 RepID=K0F5S9_NOCB7|nr:single-stranded DNA-binding protein [Nocardia brasiliensis]AFU02806.1 single-stranded DNA-binding protein [Nocardia brasiliensis ATCC 700358]OCF84552.1 single-stranded DNA-binding protein [Nocardia brasiliensis]
MQIRNITHTPELVITPSGAAVTNFTVASTPRYFDRSTNEWKDGEALFMRCNVWRDQAQHVTETLTRGARVLVSGRLKQRSYETREGDKRTVVELEVDEVGPSLRYASAKVTKTAPRTAWSETANVTARAGADDPWAAMGSREPAFAGAGAADAPGF